TAWPAPFTAAWPGPVTAAPGHSFGDLAANVLRLGVQAGGFEVFRGGFQQPHLPLEIAITRATALSSALPIARRLETRIPRPTRLARLARVARPSGLTWL